MVCRSWHRTGVVNEERYALSSLHNEVGLDTDRYPLSIAIRKNAFRLLVVDICSSVTIWV